jgi:NAD(P)H-quinone oxidoreductase subunit 6
MSVIYLPDSTNSFLFVFLEATIVITGLGVVLARKIIYSAILLAILLLCVSLWYLLLSADFLAASQVLVYVGAVNVLIVFAVMLVNKPDAIRTRSWTLADGMAALLSIVLFAVLIWMIASSSWQSETPPLPSSLPSSLENSIQTIGFHFLTDLLVPFELLSVLLLVTLIGAITIARRDVPSKFLEDTSQKATDLRRP